MTKLYYMGLEIEATASQEKFIKAKEHLDDTLIKKNIKHQDILVKRYEESKIEGINDKEAKKRVYLAMAFPIYELKATS